MNVTIVSMMAQGETWSGEVSTTYFVDHDDLGLLSDERICEILFRLFNRVDDVDAYRLQDWHYNLPSMSVGDVVTFRRRWYQRKQIWRVQPTGWKLVKRSWL